MNLNRDKNGVKSFMKLHLKFEKNPFKNIFNLCCK